MDSVQKWASAEGWAYERCDDSFFDMAPDWVRQRCAGNIYAVTDVCRLIWLRNQLDAGYERVIWADADILIFEPAHLDLSNCKGYAFSHEIFLRVFAGGRMSSVQGMNNALMVFEREQSMLDSYLDECLQTLHALPPGPVPRTELGPAMLMNLNRGHPLNMLNGIGLFTLAIMQQIANGGGPLTRECIRLSPAPLGAANLCHFLRNNTHVEDRPRFDALYNQAVSQLLDTAGDVMLSSAHQYQ